MRGEPVYHHNLSALRFNEMFVMCNTKHEGFVFILFIYLVRNCNKMLSKLSKVSVCYFVPLLLSLLCPLFPLFPLSLSLPLSPLGIDAYLCAGRINRDTTSEPQLT